MYKSLAILIICCVSFQFAFAQNFGNFPKIEKDKLLNDLEILYQGLDKFHSGMYWYTPKDSVDMAFREVRKHITTDLNVLEFHKLIAPLVALSREDHTNMYLPKSVKDKINTEIKFLPLTFVFLGTELYCNKNGSNFQDYVLEGKQIETINGETPTRIVNNIGELFASDGYIKTVKYSDLEGFNFSKHYFYYYGQVNQFEIKFKGIEELVIIKPLEIEAINQYLNSRYQRPKKNKDKKVLEYHILNNSIAYLGIHSFNNDIIKKNSKEKTLSAFLKNSFKSIAENNIKTVIVDVSKNSGGSEGNEGLVYSYFGDNYQKYKKVRTKTQKAILDNGTDKPITLKAFGFFERNFTNKKMKDGSLERKESFGKGLMAYKKEPDYKFSGKTYVIISPVTYSGGSEFSNMMYTNDLATFVGQETGGGYLGNTSGYGKALVLPNSKIVIKIPALQFVMNVAPKLPIGRGVIPHYEVIPTFEQYRNNENASLKYILEELETKR
ncbi:S41 family peptidase [Psychroserpens mesophilus]|uniref:S41 family peptidase n=1 Tax=Psychroserpens mesophilus TaxID=325473 RepID=UPI00058BA95F|nr:S41 family peptidase [Psychroserpens mesophilus]